MRLNYSEQNKAALAIVDIWDPVKYGIALCENISPYEINLMTKLLLFVYQMDLFMDNNEYIKEYNKLHSSCPSFMLIVTRGWYHYKGRIFGIPNKSFDTFLKKMKKRYKRKISLKKNIINLRNREITGKFKF